MEQFLQAGERHHFMTVPPVKVGRGGAQEAKGGAGLGIGIAVQGVLEGAPTCKPAVWDVDHLALP